MPSSAEEYVVHSQFFDTIDHRELMSIIERPVKDSIVLRLIGKWLTTGAVEKDGRRIRGQQGTPQAGAPLRRSDANAAPRPKALVWPPTSFATRTMW